MTNIENLKYIVSSWALAFPSISRVWLFGSRAKNTYRDESDIDIAIEIEVINPNNETPYAHFIGEKEELVNTLKTKVPYQIDLQFHDEAIAPLVFSYVANDGILLFDKRNQQ